MTRIVLPEGTPQLELAETSVERRKYETMENLFAALQTWELVERYIAGKSSLNASEKEKIGEIFFQMKQRFDDGLAQLEGGRLYPGSDEAFEIDAFLRRFAPDEEDPSLHTLRRAMRRFEDGIGGVIGSAKGAVGAAVRIATMLTTARNELEMSADDGTAVKVSQMKYYFNTLHRDLLEVPTNAEFKAVQVSKIDAWLAQCSSMSADDIFTERDTSQMKMELEEVSEAMSAMNS